MSLSLSRFIGTCWPSGTENSSINILFCYKYWCRYGVFSLKKGHYLWKKVNSKGESITPFTNLLLCDLKSKPIPLFFWLSHQLMIWYYSLILSVTFISILPSGSLWAACKLFFIARNTEDRTFVLVFFNKKSVIFIWIYNLELQSCPLAYTDINWHAIYLNPADSFKIQDISLSAQFSGIWIACIPTIDWYISTLRKCFSQVCFLFCI